MDFQLSEQQELLKRNARSFMEREIIHIADEYDRIRPFPKELAHELLKKLVPLGYLNGPIPIEYGGLGLDFLSYGVVLEELARAWGGLSLIALLQLGAELMLVSIATDEQGRKYLSPALTADKILCVCFTEPDFGSHLVGIQTTATRDGAHYVIDGTKAWISNGTFADVAIVLAVTKRGPKEMTLFIVDKEDSPFTVRDLPKLGLHAGATAEVSFQDCRVPSQNMLGEKGRGYKKTLTAFEFWRTALATLSVGLAQASLDAALDYAKARRAFDRPIGTFQMIQNMIVDMVAETEAARLLTCRVWSLMDRKERCEGEAALAKAYATTIGVNVASKALQIHGAYGLSEEYPLERYFRDARTMTIPDGTTEIMKLIAGRRILGISAIA